MSRKKGRGGRPRGMTQPAVYSDTALAKNAVQMMEYQNWMLAILQQRFIWEGLPETCDERYLERKLAIAGVATIAHDVTLPDVWMSVGAGAYGDRDAYNNPISWQAIGENGKAIFQVNRYANGVMVYDRKSRIEFWPKMCGIARKMAVYSRVEETNVLQQSTPYIVAAPEEQIMAAANVLGRLMAGDAAVYGYESLGSIAEDAIKVFPMKAEWLGDKLQAGALGCMSEFFRLAGIPHLQFEKGERMITDEARNSAAPTRLMLDDALKAREQAAREFNELSGLNVSVKVNPVIENMYNDLAARGGGEDGAVPSAGDGDGMA